MNLYRDLMPPTNDYVFCRLFGSVDNKNILISLLNSILNGNPFIKDACIDPTEFKKTQLNGKTIRLDVKATTDDGTIINVEMQCFNLKNLIERAVYYQSMMLRDSTIKAGESYDVIPNQISIWITPNSFTDRHACIHQVLWMFEQNKIDPIEVATDMQRIFIIELSKLEKYEADNVGDMFKKWMEFLKDPLNVPDEYLEDKEMNEAMEYLKYLSQDDESRSDYNYRQLQLSDVNSGMTEHYKKGLREGKEEGLREGEKKGENKKAIEMAKKMLSDGMSMDIITKYSGLSIEEIEKLK